MKLIPNKVHSILEIFYVINPLNLIEYGAEKPSNLLILNASATTFCRPFCMDDLLPSKKVADQCDLLASFLHPFEGQNKSSVTDVIF